jgi:hypothetical protein
MISKTTKRFRQALAQLPKDIQCQAREAYKLFSRDPHHPSLQFKKVHATDPIYSVRINIDYRAVGVLDGEAIIWFWVGSHANYDKLLDQF